MSIIAKQATQNMVYLLLRLNLVYVTADSNKPSDEKLKCVEAKQDNDIVQSLIQEIQSFLQSIKKDLIKNNKSALNIVINELDSELKEGIYLDNTWIKYHDLGFYETEKIISYFKEHLMHLIFYYTNSHEVSGFLGHVVEKQREQIMGKAN